MSKVDSDFVAGVINGQRDYDKCGGQAQLNPISELISPSYDPHPGTCSGREGYKAGWDGAKKADRG